MEFCEYHPTETAHSVCPSCDKGYCPDCVQPNATFGNDLCFHCDSPLVPRCTTKISTPFWRQLPKIFCYPLQVPVYLIVATFSVSETVLLVGEMSPRISLYIWVALVAFLMHYGLLCMVRSAEGEQRVPSLSEVFVQRGLSYLPVLVLVLSLGFLHMKVTELYPGVAWIIYSLAPILLPAILIRFSISQSLMDAIHPFSLIRVISVFGWQYVFLVIFIGIMVASSSTLSHLLLYIRSEEMAIVFQSAVNSFYTIIIFHVVGFVAYQHRQSLGFAIDESSKQKPGRPPEHVLRSKITVMLKEGNLDAVVTLFYEAFKKYPRNAMFYDDYFEFLCRCKNKRLLAEYADLYLKFLVAQNNQHNLVNRFKRIRQLLTDFTPSSARITHCIAESCQKRGDPKTAIMLLEGIYQSHPDYPRLTDVYGCLIEAYEDLPREIQAAEHYRRLLKESDNLKAVKQNRLSNSRSKRIPPETSEVRHASVPLSLVPLDEH